MRSALVALILCVGIHTVYGQEVYNSSGRPGTRKHKESSSKGFDPTRLVYGGGFGLSFGTYSTYVSVSPVIGYKLTEKFAAGIGLGYSYLYLKDYYALYNGGTGQYLYYPYKSNIIYPSLWGRYMFNNDPDNSFFAMGRFEYDFINYTQYTYDINYNVQSEPLKTGVPCLLLGLGVRKSVSERAALAFYFMYDVLQQNYSPYKSDTFFGGLVFGFGVFGGF